MIELSNEYLGDHYQSMLLGTAQNFDLVVHYNYPPSMYLGIILYPLGSLDSLYLPWLMNTLNSMS